MFEKTLSSETIYDGKIIKVKKDVVELENNHKTIREIVEHNGGVCVVAVDNEQNVFMVRQFRYAFNKILLEVPAGKIDPGEEPLAAAFRELEEEVGIKATNLISLGEMIPSCGFLTEVIHMYLATDFIETSQKLDEDEFLNIEKIPLKALVEEILANNIIDGKTIASILKANSYLSK